jgi:hypothetical protein
VRGDHDLNEVKAGKVPGLKAASASPPWPRSRTTSAASRATWARSALRKPVKVVADRTRGAMSDFVCGANEADFHYTGVNWGRDLPEPDLVADIRNVVAGDPSPDGKGVLAIQRGIEVGHVFYLGTKYSEAMNATYLDETASRSFRDGLLRHRRHAHAGRGHRAEPRRARHHLAGGDGAVHRGDLPDRLWTAAPRCGRGRALHDELQAAGVDVLLDDRGERPGAMFADWELIGVPARGGLRPRPEGRHGRMQGRRDAAATVVPLADAGCREGPACTGMTPTACASPSRRAGCWRAAACWVGRGPRGPAPGRGAAGRLRCAARCRPPWPTWRRPSRASTHRGAPGLPALAGRDERAAQAAQGRAPDADRVPGDRLVREPPRRPGDRRWCWA